MAGLIDCLHILYEWHKNDILIWVLRTFYIFTGPDVSNFGGAKSNFLNVSDFFHCFTAVSFVIIVFGKECFGRKCIKWPAIPTAAITVHQIWKLGGEVIVLRPPQKQQLVFSYILCHCSDHGLLYK